MAGKELRLDGGPSGWIRPVSNREDQGVSEYERQYEGGHEPDVLDVIDVPVLNAQPDDYQTENWLLNPDVYWEKVGRVSPGELGQFTDPASPLWIDGYHTTNGRNNRVPFSLAKSSLQDSLRLIKVGPLDLDVSWGRVRGTKQVDGIFTHLGIDYRLRVTDPTVQEYYRQRQNRTYELDERYLTVSLGGDFQGYAYKLIAAIIKP